MRLPLGLLALLTALFAALAVGAGTLAWRHRESLGMAGPKSAAAAQPRKCLRGASVLYTNDVCPPGSREQALTGGSVSIVKSAPAAASGSATKPGRIGNARDLLLDPQAVDIKERRMEEVIGR